MILTAAFCAVFALGFLAGKGKLPGIIAAVKARFSK